MLNFKNLVAMCLLAVSTGALAFGGPSQSSICVASNLEDLQQCKNGEVLAFQPDIFGNEQLPIIVSAMACDFNYPIVSNVGGVSCIFTDKRKKEW
jgi:hypothetical protein